MSIEHPLNTAVFELAVATPSDPAAGAQLRWTDFGNNRVQILSLTFTLTTDGTVLDRYVLVAGSDATDRFQEAPAPVKQTQTLVYVYHFSSGGTNLDLSAAILTQYANLPADLILHEGDELRTNVYLLQAADQISDVVIRYKQWSNH